MHPIFGLTTLTMLVCALTGCATYRADPLDGEAELATLRGRDLRHFSVERAVPGQDAVGFTSAAVGFAAADTNDLSFDVSDGLDESEVVAVALTLNPALRSKRAQVGEARAALVTAGLFPNPELAVSPKVGIGSASGYSVEADALVQLLQPGERNARQQAARYRTEEVVAEVVAEEFRLLADVRSQHLAVLAAERTVALLQEGADLRVRAVDLVRRRRQIGEGTELDISVAELETAEARRDLRKAQVQLEAELRELNRLMGLSPQYPLKLVGMGQPLTITVFGDITDEQVDEWILVGRLEVRAMEAAYQRAEQELRLAVLQQYPRLGIGPAFEKELEGDKALGLSLRLELPIFNQNQGEIAEKEAARQRLRAEYSALLHRLRSDALVARAAVRAAKAEVEMQEEEVLPLVQRNQELFEGAFAARELNVIDWMTAQQRAVNARREYLDSLVRYRRAVIQLEAAIGQPFSRAATQPATRPRQPAH